MLMIVAFNVPTARADEVERWYRQEHAPMLLRAPGWLRMRRYEPMQSAGGPQWTHLALHELRDAAVLESAERALARSTAWRAQLDAARAVSGFTWTDGRRPTCCWSRGSPRDQSRRRGDLRRFRKWRGLPIG